MGCSRPIGSGLVGDGEATSAGELRATLAGQMEPVPIPQEAIQTYRKLAKQLDAFMEGELRLSGPVAQLAARLVVFLVRQAESIALLARQPYYGEQIGQLVRGLIDLWATTAWMNSPPEVSERLARAVGYSKQGLRFARNKMEYRGKYALPSSQRRWVELKAQEDIIAEQEQSLLDGRAGVERPSTKEICEQLDRPVFYAVFREESDSTHASSISVGQMVREASDTRVELGGPTPIDVIEKRLLVAADVTIETGNFLVAALGFDEKVWANTVEEVRAELGQLIGGGRSTDHE